MRILFEGERELERAFEPGGGRRSSLRSSLVRSAHRMSIRPFTVVTHRPPRSTFPSASTRTATRPERPRHCPWVATYRVVPEGKRRWAYRNTAMLPLQLPQTGSSLTPCELAKDRTSMSASVPSFAANSVTPVTPTRLSNAADRAQSGFSASSRSTLETQATIHTGPTLTIAGWTSRSIRPEIASNSSTLEASSGAQRRGRTRNESARSAPSPSAPS